jgi:hypothetical protein
MRQNLLPASVRNPQIRKILRAHPRWPAPRDTPL